MRRYWISCPQFTIQTNVLDGCIVWTAPVVRRFTGQRLENLLYWLRRFGDVTVEDLQDETLA